MEKKGHPFIPFFQKKAEMPQKKPLKAKMHVILTGSTGSLGAYLLDALLAHAAVERITCLNRSDDAEQRQKSNHSSRGLSTDFPPSRVDFLQYDLSAPWLGLITPAYFYLTSEVTHVVHNAWPVDFNLHLSSFEPHIRGVGQLIDFVAHCKYDAELFFISSISVASDWGAVAGARAQVPEMILEDWRLASMGYGQSKLVSERLLAEASKISGIRTSVCRVGQVAGPVLRGTKGAWNKREWLPSLIASSKYLRKVPKDLGPMEVIDWIPVDWLGKIIVELLPAQWMASLGSEVREERAKTAVYHIVNPSHATWASLLPTATRHFPNDVLRVTFLDWVSALQQSASKGESLSENPAVKLLPFFERLQDKALRFPRARAATLDMQQTARHSESLMRLEPVSPMWMELWMKQWAF